MEKAGGSQVLEFGELMCLVADAGSACVALSDRDQTPDGEACAMRNFCHVAVWEHEAMRPDRKGYKRHQETVL